MNTPSIPDPPVPTFTPQPSTGGQVKPQAPPPANPVAVPAAPNLPPKPAPVALDVTASAGRKPVPLAIPTPAPPPAQPKAPPLGWWKVEGIKGGKDAVGKAIAALPGIPPHWKAVLAAELAQHPSAAVAVHAHFAQQNRPLLVNGQKTGQSEKGKIVIAIDISPLDGYVS